MVNCPFCGTALPAGAQFCGECGGNVGASTAAPRMTVAAPAGPAVARREMPPVLSTVGSSQLLTDSAPRAQTGSLPRPLVDSVSRPIPAEHAPFAPRMSSALASDGDYTCPQCGSSVAETDVYCGSCGFVLSVSAPRPAVAHAAAPTAASYPPAASPLVPPPVAPAPVVPVAPAAPSVEPDLAAAARAAQAAVEAAARSAAPVPPAAPAAVSRPAMSAPAHDDLEDLALYATPFAIEEAGEPEAAGAATPEPSAAIGRPDEGIFAVSPPLDPALEATGTSIPRVVLPLDEPAASEAPLWAPVEAWTPGGQAPERPQPVAAPQPLAAPQPEAPARAVPDPFPWGSPQRPGADVEATRIVASPSTEDRYTLQFSTGESVTVSGSGLIGRNPSAQPGEFVDQLITIFDGGKSVSKTHLEFGQEGGRFWVSDRYSTNGSTIRQPDADARRCEPGRRYFVARGTRVDIGEQFFVVG